MDKMYICTSISARDTIITIIVRLTTITVAHIHKVPVWFHHQAINATILTIAAQKQNHRPPIMTINKIRLVVPSMAVRSVLIQKVVQWPVLLQTKASTKNTSGVTMLIIIIRTFVVSIGTIVAAIPTNVVKSVACKWILTRMSIPLRVVTVLFSLLSTFTLNCQSAKNTIAIGTMNSANSVVVERRAATKTNNVACQSHAKNKITNWQIRRNVKANLEKRVLPHATKCIWCVILVSRNATLALWMVVWFILATGVLLSILAIQFQPKWLRQSLNTSEAFLLLVCLSAFLSLKLAAYEVKPNQRMPQLLVAVVLLMLSVPRHHHHTPHQPHLVIDIDAGVITINVVTILIWRCLVKMVLMNARAVEAIDCQLKNSGKYCDKHFKKVQQCNKRLQQLRNWVRALGSRVHLRVQRKLQKYH